MKKIIIFFLLLVLMQPVNAAEIPIINSYVTDKAGVLSADAKLQLENDLRELEKSTNGVQYVIYIENEYPKDYSLEEYTLKIAEANKIGKKGNDNGILFYVAIKDRKYRWETGYGVESTLNSALLGRISREYLVPNFQAGNYEKGILQTFDVTKRILLGSSDADIVALEKEGNTKVNNSGFIFGIFLIIFIIFILFAAFNRIQKLQKYQKNKKYKDSFYHGAASGLFWGSFGRGGFGGGSSGGGFGGFSGGGGGFGGGGGGGGW